MSKYIVVALQTILSIGSLVLAYFGERHPMQPLLVSALICAILVIASAMLMKKRFSVASALVIATHLVFVLMLPLNS